MIYYFLIAIIIFFSIIFVIERYFPNCNLQDNDTLTLTMILAFIVSAFWPAVLLIAIICYVLYWCTKKVIKFAKRGK